MQGYIDDFRVANGAIRNSQDFVLPTWQAGAVQHNGLDDYYSSVALLITGQGTNGSTPVDRGPGGVALTVNGTTNSTGVFNVGTSSLLFNGTSNVITCNAGSYAGDFTLEYWSRTSPSPPGVWNATGGTTWLSSTQFSISGNVLSFSGWSFGSSTTTWYYITVMRKSGVIHFYQNGVWLASWANATTLNLSALKIGRGPNDVAYQSGNVQDFRVTGLARYVPGKTFTPPAAPQPTAVSNFGDPLYTTYGKLLLRANGTNGSTTFTDESPAARTLTAVGGAQISTAWATYGGSALALAGSTDAVSAASSSDFSMAAPSSQFVVDFRVRLTSISTGTPWLFNFEIDSSNYWGMYLNNGLLMISSVSGGVETHYNTGVTLGANTDYHIEIDKGPGSFGALSVYVNGTHAILPQGDRILSGVLSGAFGPVMPSPAASAYGLTVDGTPVLSSAAKGLVINLQSAQFFGTGTISGVVNVISTAAPYRKVRVYDKASGVFARETTSDASGNYAFTNLDKTRAYYVTAFDNVGGYNATIEDWVTPS